MNNLIQRRLLVSILLVPITIYSKDASDVVSMAMTKAVTDSCGRVSLSSTNPITISTPGTYCLDSDAVAITIAADYVDLDLGGHKVTNLISSSNNYAQITNGIITDSLQITNGADLLFSNLIINGGGVQCNGSQRIGFINCKSLNASTGFTFSNVVRGVVTDCEAINNRINGFMLNTCQDTTLVRCKSLDNGFGVGTIIPATYTYGFVSQNGLRNALYECEANGITSNSTLFASVAAGFALLGSETGTIIADSVSAFNGRGMVSGIAYGIWLQSSFPIDNNGSKLFQFATQNQGQGCYAIAWSPDGKYVAFGGLRDSFTNADVQVFQFDPLQSNPWTRIAAVQQGGGCFALSWSPNGKYLATGGYAQNTGVTPNAETVQVFSFNPTSPLALTRIAAQNQGQNATKPTCYAVAWSADSKYLAVGGLPQSGADLQVFNFDPQTNALNRVAVQLQGGQCNALSWAPNGKYLAVGGKPQNGIAVQIFSFDATALSNGLSISPIGVQALGTECRSLGFAPSGNYLAAAGSNGTNGSEVQLLAFDPLQTNAIANRVGIQTQNYCNSLSWSADEKYLVVGSKVQTSPWNNDIQVFKVDTTQPNAISLYAMQLQGTESYACSWSPDGRFIAAGSNISGSTAIKVYNALQFPFGNTIVNNRINDVRTSTTKPSGIGIYGSSNANIIINNQAYNNVIDYVFVTNTRNISLKN